MEIDYFALLPDEIVLKILQNTVDSLKYDKWSRKKKDMEKWSPSHDFLINTIGQVSTRFKRLTFDPTLWMNEISISDKQNLVEILQNYKINNVKDLQVHYNNNNLKTISRHEMTKIANICQDCPELVEFYHMNDGKLHSTWSNLEVYRNYDKYEIQSIDDLEPDYVIGDLDSADSTVIQSIYGLGLLSNGTMYTIYEIHRNIQRLNVTHGKNYRHIWF